MSRPHPFPLFVSWHGRLCRAAVTIALTLGAALAQAQPASSKNLAPGFTKLPVDSRIVLMPVDAELFSLSAGGVPEPKADWTAAATGHMQAALVDKLGTLGVALGRMDETTADEFAEQVGLHAAVARSIAQHQFGAGVWALPTKDGKLDWTFGDSMQPLQARTGARYGLFVWVRDSYASAERKAAMVALALLGVGVSGGVQVGYASLVDLESGQVMWFNLLARGWGDLRERTPAIESINALMAGFPAVK